MEKSSSTRRKIHQTNLKNRRKGRVGTSAASNKIVRDRKKKMTTESRGGGSGVGNVLVEGEGVKGVVKALDLKGGGAGT